MAPVPSGAKPSSFRSSMSHSASDLGLARSGPDRARSVFFPNLRRKGSDLLRWVERLVAHRAAQQGCPVRPPYFVPPNMDQEDAAAWYQTQYMQDPDPLKRPRYLLIWGDCG